MIARLDQFDSYVESYAVKILVRKLAIIAYWVCMRAEFLYRAHEGEGYVCVFLTENDGISINWVEREKIVADRARFRTYGYILLSVEELANMSIQLVMDLANGEWAKVVDWIKRYERSPGLDFDNFP